MSKTFCVLCWLKHHIAWRTTVLILCNNTAKKKTKKKTKTKREGTWRNETFSVSLKHPSHYVPRVKLMVDVCWPNVLVRVVLQACLCSWSLPLQAVTRDEVQSVLKSRMQDQASEQSCHIKAPEQTSTPLPEQGSTLPCWQNSCRAVKSLSKTPFYIPLLIIYLAIKAAAISLTCHPNNTLRITCSAVFYAAVVSWTSALAWATWSQTVPTICPWGLTHSQTLHQILPSTYPVSCITVLKSLFWARC